MMTISFKVPREVMGAIMVACERYHALLVKHQMPEVSHKELLMDLIACHANGCPIDWVMLDAADDFTFIHDITGIQNHINRQTGKIERAFVPRCAARE